MASWSISFATNAVQTGLVGCAQTTRGIAVEIRGTAGGRAVWIRLEQRHLAVERAASVRVAPDNRPDQIGATASSEISHRLSIRPEPVGNST